MRTSDGKGARGVSLGEWHETRPGAGMPSRWLGRSMVQKRGGEGGETEGAAEPCTKGVLLGTCGVPGSCVDRLLLEGVLGLRGRRNGCLGWTGGGSCAAGGNDSRSSGAAHEALQRPVSTGHCTLHHACGKGGPAAAGLLGSGGSSSHSLVAPVGSVQGSGSQPHKQQRPPSAPASVMVSCAAVACRRARRSAAICALLGSPLPSACRKSGKRRARVN